MRWAAALYAVLALAGLLWISGGAAIEADVVFGRSSEAPFEILVDLLIGLVVGLALVGLWRLGVRWARFADLERYLVNLVGPLTRDQAWALALFSGVGEEIFFRGALLVHWGLLPSTLIFALLHTGRTPSARLWGALAFLVGLILAALTLWRASLLPAIVAHTVINGLQLQRIGAEADGIPTEGAL